MADWSELATDVLELITSKLELSDYHRFGAVCRNWQAAAKAKHYRPANQLPWLILGEDAEIKKRVIYSLSKKKHYYMDILELRGHICLGSSGWLFTIDEELDGHLLNPLTLEHYKLPPFPDYNKGRTIEDAKALQEYERYRIKSRRVMKAIMSDDPSEGQDFTLVTLYHFNRTVVFWWSGDTNWTELKCPYGQIQDVTYFNGTLFGVIGCYCLVYFDLGPYTKLTPRYPLVRKRHWSKEAPLVDLDGESLLLIQRIEASCIQRFQRFR